ncbi:related to transcription elongation factor 1 [Rhynchosporium agropyri]|uniref:Transcription elongation factor 1 homolog n=1 Tax=Rhynchosporium agropyri TaxID=914238 RepID=A0A1E1JY90_9HELO|nr:related to transcription elongation factor 1 [Rhynchosporium agropyri]
MVARGRLMKDFQNAPLPSTFDCLFCNHVNSVIVKLDKKAGVGALSCKVCSQHFQCAINYLSAAVDVYSDWVDACDAVAKGDGDEIEGDDRDRDTQRAQARLPSGGAARPRARPRDDDEDVDDLIDDADADEDDGGYGRDRDGVIADDEY